jgi:hypothetical protein
MIAAAGRLIASMILLGAKLPEGVKVQSVDWTERVEGDTLYIKADVTLQRDLKRVQLKVTIE